MIIKTAGKNEWSLQHFFFSWCLHYQQCNLSSNSSFRYLCVILFYFIFFYFFKLVVFREKTSQNHDWLQVRIKWKHSRHGWSTERLSQILLAKVEIFQILTWFTFARASTVSEKEAAPEKHGQFECECTVGEVRALIQHDQSGNKLQLNLCLGLSKCSWHTTTKPNPHRECMQNLTHYQREGDRVGRILYGCVSRTVTKQIIRSFSKYTVAVDVVYIRELQLPMFNRPAFIYLTTVSYPLDKSHSCSDLKAPFSSKAWTVTRHWMDERQCQWTRSVLWRSSPCAHLLYMSVWPCCCSKHWHL